MVVFRAALGDVLDERSELASRSACAAEAAEEQGFDFPLCVQKRASAAAARGSGFSPDRSSSVVNRPFIADSACYDRAAPPRPRRLDVKLSCEPLRASSPCPRPVSSRSSGRPAAVRRLS